MRRTLPIALIAVLALAACKGKPQTNATADESGAPQVATSIEDYELPVDRSAQITAIDAATGDASGMPKDGGAVVQTAKREEAATSVEQAPVAVEEANVQTPVPVVAPPAPTIATVPGTN